MLNGLLVAKHVARRELARGRAAAHEIERALAHADPAHAVVDAPGAKPLLRQHEALPFFPDAIRDRYAALLVHDFGVTEVVVASLAHDRDVAHEAEPGRVERDDDLAGAGVRARRV